MTRFRIYPYKLPSKSARRLKEALGGLPLLKPDGNYTPRQGDKIINWGNSTVPNFSTDNMLNKPQSVLNASNKLRTFRKLEEAGIPTIPFTTDIEVASDWDDVYVRHQLQGHSGAGIEIVDLHHDLPVAPLYTKKIDNNGEYRVHVMNGEVFDYRKKSRLADDEATEEQGKIRTLGNGWIYRQGNLKRLERIEELAKSAIRALGLDFGAVDIIMDGDGNVFVLEINTAVGLADNTLESYITKFKEHYATN